MAEIISYTNEQLRAFAANVAKAFENNLKTALPFEVWEEKAFKRLYKKEGTKYPLEVRVAPTAREMLDIIKANSNRLDAIDRLAPELRENAKLKLFKEILQPNKVFTVEKEFRDERTQAPIWFGSTEKSAKVLVGFLDGNKENPFFFELGDDFVHAKMSGGTGSGKSVTMHTLVSNLLLMYAPWEINLYLADFKLVELTKYASPVEAPHVTAIIGSENTVLAASVFAAYAEEMKDRSALFQQVGVSSLKDFRKRFNMVMPRCIMLVDEFAQLFVNLKKAVDSGSATADEEKKDINNAIGEIARLGRSMGMHMLLSSQSLAGLLEEQTDKQFAGGIALKVNTPDDSNAVIGNDAAAYITAKGRGIINLNRASKSEANNKMVQIPFINCELSEKDQLEGKQTYVTETVTMLKKMSDKLNTSTDLFYYDDNTLAPISKFQEDLGMAYDRFINSPYNADESEELKIRNEIYKENTAMCLTLGRSVRYSRTLQFFLDLTRKQSNNIIVSGTNKVYLLSLLAQNFKYYAEKGLNFNHIIVNGDVISYRLSGLHERLNMDNKQNQILPENKLPIRVYSKVKARESLYTLSNIMKSENALTDYDTTGPFGTFNCKVALEYFFNKTAAENSLVGRKGITVNVIPSLVKYFEGCMLKDSTTIDAKELREYITGLDKSYDDNDVTNIFHHILLSTANAYTTFSSFTQLKRYITPSDFTPLYIWLLGADTFEDIVEKNRDVQQLVSAMILKGPLYNVFTIMTATNWDKLITLTDNFNIVIEREGRKFFQAINMTNSINIYDMTFQVHDREAKTKTIIKEFKLT